MKTTARRNFFANWQRLAGLSFCVALISGCAALRPEPAPGSPTLYSLDAALKAKPSTTPAAPLASAPTLLISTPRAAAGFDSPRIIFVREAHKLEYFAHNEWVDTPARMLAPLVVAAVENSGAFKAVVHAPSSASGDLRLDTEILQLQQEFEGGTSQVRFALRANMVEDASRRVVASRVFESLVSAPSANPYGGVVAANQAVQSVLANVATFCVETGGSWRPKNVSDPNDKLR
jgi:cholesterol transport system auxiliary component